MVRIERRFILMNDKQARPLALKLLDIMNNVGAVPPDRDYRNQYKYHSHEIITNAVKNELFESGVLLQMSMTDYAITERQDNKKTVQEVTGKFLFKFIDCHTGEIIESKWAGTGTQFGPDGADRAMYKAMTGAIKSYLKAQFLIVSNDSDPDNPPQQTKTQQATATDPGQRPQAPATANGMSKEAFFLYTKKEWGWEPSQTIMAFNILGYTGYKPEYANQIKQTMQTHAEIFALVVVDTNAWKIYCEEHKKMNGWSPKETAINWVYKQNKLNFP